jgi:predicted short-subunit dehydrogenase-like oxidoreductase (DUF2520 family)
VTETGERLDLGDPWPAVRWPKAVLEPEARRPLAIWKAGKAVERGDAAAVERHKAEADEAFQDAMAAQREIINRKAR